MDVSIFVCQFDVMKCRHMNLQNSHFCNPNILGMSHDFRFIVSHGGNFVHSDDEWKWRGDKTTSILVSRSITVAELLLRLKEKLGIVESRNAIELKFKVPNLNLPLAEIRDDEDLQWYISVHKETALCITYLVFKLPIVGMATDANCEGSLFGPTECPSNVQHDEMNHQHNRAFIAEIDETMSSNSRRSCTDEWITAANTSVLAEKQIFFTKKQLCSKLHVLALQEKFQFRVSRSSLKMLIVVCVDDNCKWMLRASTVKQSAIFMIRKFVAVHTCSLDFRRNAHRHATSVVIAEHILEKLDTPYRSYPPTYIARDMEREFGVKISYSKARRGKLHALNMLHGTPRDSFQKLSSYCHVVGESNPGTVTHIEVDCCNRFRYFFVAFGASIRGYMQYLRPVICVDGSHLKGPYKGTLLVATAQDGNKQIYPLAWGIVDAETNKSWKWFLSNLKDLIGDSEELVFVSDRKKSIQKAISQLFPSSRHGCCIWHMEKNLIQRYNNASLLFLFK
ncbi:uncharacterized protein LOC111397985 [Olea europaea var. sylvestris]|uniref:uncharacterized protein LOC111397985 n=1 Tax=Olea europaea var. sylvestris TaxID=158386 RepID=UPI000C1D3922|nr:uncharacterized protein LOC111397985 [Olea europaea var. sylvestris]